MGTHDAISPGDIGWHTGHTVLSRFSPVGVYGLFESPVFKGRSGLADRQSYLLCEVDEYFQVTDILFVDEIGFIKGSI